MRAFKPPRVLPLNVAVERVKDEELNHTAVPIAAAGLEAELVPESSEVERAGTVPGEEEDEGFVSRLPPSDRNMLYFGVSTEGDRRVDSIAIVDIDTSTTQLYDRSGRRYGNQSVGYAVKQDPLALERNVLLKIGTKVTTILTALPEDTFRSGEFFLHTEHKAKRLLEKQRQAQQVIPRKPKLTLGAGFGALQLRKRPREGASSFVVPLLGRKKDGKRNDVVTAIHDHDAPSAVVLFRADYKRDAQNRPICSVVVDPVIGDKLRPHQKVGVQFLYDCITGERVPGYFGAILADEMGLGKTIQTVATIWTCLKQGKHGTPISRKCIVVAPSSLVKNWCNEFEKWLGEGKVKAFAIAESTPKGDRILSRFEGEGDVLVISYDQLRKYITRLQSITAVELVVCDEGHRLKNAEIKTTKAVAALPAQRRIILSGTPIQNDLSEFHAMVDFVNPGIIGQSDLFKRVFEDPIMAGRDPETPEEEKELGQERASYLANLTQRFILRRTQAINEKYLPAKVDMTVFCGLGRHQKYVYQAISAKTSEFSSSPLVLITALKKLCCHLDLLHSALSSDLSKAKLPLSIFPRDFALGSLSPSSGSKTAFVSLMLDQLKASPQRDKLVIVSNYTQTLDVIAKLCQSKQVHYFQLDGSTPIKKRQELVDRFNVPTQRETVFLLSSKAGGVGLNLIGANRLILFDPDWNPANDAQAMGRVWRDGQKKKVFLYRLLSTGTIEEKIYQRQVSKQGLSANVVDMKEDSKQHFTSDELKALFSFREDTMCETHDLLGCRCCSAIQEKPKHFGMIKQRTGPRMDELKSWMHIDDISKFTLDPMLADMCRVDSSVVTFLFANERDAEKIVDVECEVPFVADTSRITCQSQADDVFSQIEVAVVDDDSDDEF